MSLKWITEDEDGTAPAEGGNGRDGGPRRRWTWLILLLALAGMLALYGRQMSRVQAQEAELAEEVSANHRLWTRAVLEGDQELFENLLLKGDPAWFQAQQRLFSSERLLGRDALGFQLDREAEPAIQHVEIAPDWQSALVDTDYAYHVLGPAGVTETVWLQHSARYERLGDRWRYAPLGDDYWGVTQRVEGEWTTAVVPERDQSLIGRLHERLDSELTQLCAGLAASSPCSPGMRIVLQFETDPALLDRPADEPVFRGTAYLLPSPSLVGLPADETAIDALYHGYAAEILATVQHNLLPPTPLPEQDIATLCFPEEQHQLGLFRYDAYNEAWWDALPGRTFRYLSSAPGGDGIVLQERERGQAASHLRLIWSQASGEQLLFSGENPDRLSLPVGWSGPGEDPRLLVYSSALNRADIFYSLLDANRCDGAGCAMQRLAGYTQWSPSGDHTIVSRRDGLWLGDANGEPQQPLEPGFSPFWLDEVNYGYARYDYPDEGAALVEIVTGTIGRAGVEVALRSTGFVLSGGGLFFIDYAAVNPVSPSQLLVSGPVLKSNENEYIILSLQLHRPETLRLIARLPDTLRGVPGALTPTGYPPFSFSPDGRWLMVSSAAEPATAGWTMHLYDLQTGLRRAYKVEYPPYPAKYPFTAWSANGEWLAIVEDGYLRLIAPTHDYERLAPHPYDACLFVAWVNR